MACADSFPRRGRNGRRTRTRFGGCSPTRTDGPRPSVGSVPRFGCASGASAGRRAVLDLPRMVQRVPRDPPGGEAGRPPLARDGRTVRGLAQDREDRRSRSVLGRRRRSRRDAEDGRVAVVAPGTCSTTFVGRGRPHAGPCAAPPGPRRRSGRRRRSGLDEGGQPRGLRCGHGSRSASATTTGPRTPWWHRRRAARRPRPSRSSVSNALACRAGHRGVAGDAAASSASMAAASSRPARERPGQSRAETKTFLGVVSTRTRISTVGHGASMRGTRRVWPCSGYPCATDEPRARGHHGHDDQDPVHALARLRDRRRGTDAGSCLLAGLRRALGARRGRGRRRQRAGRLAVRQCGDRPADDGPGPRAGRLGSGDRP